jgi:predicted XRE-type DNA-binding protein
MRSKRSNEPEVPHLTRGSVLDDLGFGPAEALEIKVKAEIYRDLLAYLKEQAFTQQELGRVLGLHQPDVSHLLNGRISKFSLGKLIQLAGRLNLEAQVKLRKPKTKKRTGIVAAAGQQRSTATLA